MAHMYIAKNKTEELTNDVTGRLLRSKRKYFVVCENIRGVLYVDSAKDRKFLEKVRDRLTRILEETR